MPVIIDVSPDLKEALGEKGGKALIELLNQFDAMQRNEYEHWRDFQMQLMEKSLAWRLDSFSEQIQLAIHEAVRDEKMPITPTEAKAIIKLVEAEARKIFLPESMSKQKFTAEIFPALP